MKIIRIQVEKVCIDKLCDNYDLVEVRSNVPDISQGDTVIFFDSLPIHRSRLCVRTVISVTKVPSKYHMFAVHLLKVETIELLY